MFIRWYANSLVNHACLIFFTVSIFSVICLILPFHLKSMAFPSFQDPQMGFTTRGTIISNRFAAYTNLIKATRPSGNLTINPKEYLKTLQTTKSNTISHNKFNRNRQKKNTKPKENEQKERFYGEVKNETNSKTTGEASLAENKWKVLKKISKTTLKDAENFFCGRPDDRYAHFVVKSRTDEDLFTLQNLLSLCRLERSLTELRYYQDLCILNMKAPTKLCCNAWSLTNSIAALRQKDSCLDITEEDVEFTMNLLLKCAYYFINVDLTYFRDDKLSDAPFDCERHEAVFNILYYLVPTNFLASKNGLKDEKLLPMTMIFLPMASSTAIVPYYHEFEKHLSQELEGLHIAAVDFGIKSALFDEYLKRDTVLIFIGADFIFFCLWIYTRSFFIALMTIAMIIYSLAISYFMYFLVFNIEFFPFMNLLAAIVILGIGSDDAVIFCKTWGLEKQDVRNNNCLPKIMIRTLRHAGQSMLVTALTTGVAFLGSFVSTVTAISCFSIFAGTAVAVNYVLMMTFFPACIIIWEKHFVLNDNSRKAWFITYFHAWTPQWNFTAVAAWLHLPKIVAIWNGKKTFLIKTVIKLRYVWITSLSALGIASVVVVFIYPKIQLPNTPEFQLFSRDHVFEQFDFVYKQKFGLNNQEMIEYKMPMQFVWGVLPIDNGDYLNPSDYGTVVMDPSFDIADPQAQEWLLKFCHDIKLQPFFHNAFSPLLQNCFIETFQNSMRRPCIESLSGKDVSPCCEVTKFPINRTLFNRCAIEEIAEILATPTVFLTSHVAGPKFFKDQNSTIKALVLEYDSNYTFSLSFEELNKFYTTVEAWTQVQLKTAPATLKNGFFTSDLGFYDLQRELSRGTINAVLYSMGLAFVVLFLCTLNIITSIIAIITIMLSILVTMAILAIMGWRLNILESLAISTAIGLTVDFSLHYSVNYRLCPEEIAVSREASTQYALSYMSGPALMVALTTVAAGAFMTFSSILPYIQIGEFFMIVMSVSWFYSTFFLCALLATIGPTRNQYSYFALLCRLVGKPNNSDDLARPEERTSSISGCHELDSLTLPEHDRPTPKPCSKPVCTDHSLSPTSEITIMFDGN